MYYSRHCLMVSAFIHLWLRLNCSSIFFTHLLRKILPSRCLLNHILIYWQQRHSTRIKSKLIPAKVIVIFDTSKSVVRIASTLLVLLVHVLADTGWRPFTGGGFKDRQLAESGEVYWSLCSCLTSQRIANEEINAWHSLRADVDKRCRQSSVTTSGRVEYWPFNRFDGHRANTIVKRTTDTMHLSCCTEPYKWQM